MPARRTVYLRLLYDRRDAALIEGSAWCLSNGYPSRRRDGDLEYLHVLIMGKKDGKEVDHKNGNFLDVRRKNLRFVTHHANTQNLRDRGSRGVSFDKKRGKWRAYASLHGK